ncbi:MAG: hypothetical protein QXD03_02535 [Candidatus Anstonellales archaeon]
MRVLVCGGIKTQNIINGISKKFEASGVSFIVVKSIDDIDNVLTRGDYYDKALIIEPSWNDDGNIIDEREMRIRISNFVNLVLEKKLTDSRYIFLAQSESMASMVYEEILYISNISTVVFKKPPYSVNFFTMLIRGEADSYPEDIVYKLKVTTEDIPEESMKDEDLYGIQEIDDLTSDLDGEFNSDMTLDMEQLLNVNYKNIEDEGIDNEFDTFNNELNIEDSLDETGDIVDISNGDSLSTIIDGMYEGEEDEIGGEVYEGVDEEANGVGVDIQNINKDTNVGVNRVVSVQRDNLAGDILGVSSGGINRVQNVEGKIHKNKKEVDSLNDDVYNSTINDVNKVNGGVGNIRKTHNLNNDIGTDIHNIQSNSDNLVDEFDSVYEGSSNDINVLSDELYTSKTNNDNRIYNRDTSKVSDTDDKVNKMNVNMTVNEVKQENKSKKILGLFSKDKGKGNKVDIQSLINDINIFANRGTSIAVTGCEGSGVTTVAYNLANTLYRLGFSVLLVDTDVLGRGQAYICKDSYMAVGKDDYSLLSSLKSSIGIDNNVNIIKPGFKLLTMGLAGDVLDYNNIDKSNVLRFVNIVKSKFHFIVYDLPFKYAITNLSDIIYTADNIVSVVDSSNWGITKYMLYMCNIDNDEIQEVMFSLSGIVLNKWNNLQSVMGSRVRSYGDILDIMDKQVFKLLGDEPDLLFSNMSIFGSIPFDLRCDMGCYSENQLTDYEDGFNVFVMLLKNILFKKCIY